VLLLRKMVYMRFKIPKLALTRKDIALLLITAGLGYWAFPLQNVLNNIPKLGLREAIMLELSTAWPSLIAGIALILVALKLLFARDHDKDIERDNKEIIRLLHVLIDRNNNGSRNKPKM
jgi:hypothetical protein